MNPAPNSLLALLAAVIMTSSGGSLAASAPLAADALEAGFRSPPDSAKPRVWWHWMNGNVTEEGIRLDMEWMKRVGIGGMQNFDAAFATPVRVQKRLVYSTPEWQHAFGFAAQTADRLGLELSIAGSPGWSESGGPWVAPQQAMKKLVWSETRITGGKAYSGVLAPPPATVGPYQNVPLDNSGGPGGIEITKPAPELYADVAVIAYQRPAAERSMAELKPAVTASSGNIDGAALWDGDLNRAVSIAYPDDGSPAWVQLDLGRPISVRALSLVLAAARARGFGRDTAGPVAELQSSADGTRFSKIIDVHVSAAVQQTLAFAPVTARYFRLLMPKPAAAAPTLAGLNMGGAPQTAHRIAELVLHAGGRVNRAEDKAGFFVAADLDAAKAVPVPAEATVDRNRIIDLTARMRSDGTLNWNPPAGNWVVLRIGYSLLGINNHPASPEGTGLEVDKLSREHVQSYISQYLDNYARFLPAELMGKRGLQGMINDSWEAGAQNWTESLPAEFARRRGYDLRPWLPALTGMVIGSAEETERFLWDFRRTLEDLLAENHYGLLAENLHRRGMIHYVESHEGGRAMLVDGMDAKRFSDVPMSAMWASGVPQDPSDADIRESASVAHLYGQNLVAAESFTAAGNTFAFVPETLKATADRELVAGLNRFVIHTSVHQPLNDPGPGFTLGPFGQWFTRHETWAQQAGSWVSYLTRSSYLLQQGRFAADVLYFYGEDSNITALFGAGLPPMPAGYSYDFANLSALDTLTVEDGQLVSRSGARYRVLMLDPRTQSMSLSALTRIRDLVQAGATVIGARPASSPSLADDQVAFRAMADSLWGTTGDPGSRTVGKGRVLAGSSSVATLVQLGIAPDFQLDTATNARIAFVHRHLDDGELYFVSNRQGSAADFEASFRITGKRPEIWRADSGGIEPVSYRIVDGRTVVSLSMEPTGALFVVFRKPAVANQLSVPPVRRQDLAALAGPWELRFSPGEGAPATTRIEQLASWTQSADTGIKYYSGTASYLHGMNIPAAWIAAGRHVELDLGAVKNVAEVLVNGSPVGMLWKPPFRIDISQALRTGSNQLEVRVTNTWVNRLIGDKQPGAKAYAYATFDPYKVDSLLLDSGLLGPVRLLSVSR